MVIANPRNRSRTCTVCAYCNKSNRKSQGLFVVGRVDMPPLLV
ncbi:MAG: hypothetical protein AVDCRST_MAG93-3248 [uncultured Chloroflexia bacterium]|uniref:Uncharacterized protein n=1 Tax=uncultured Chloroflexia bacterium TaxID=1672391 RepID=A0A6J4JLV6_9CHLR|nr:MAG: hypothetical protein AVDCRST_MAG93-3248 [uncultured Chloroflexia bacterium]